MEPLRTLNRQNDLENKDQSFSPLDFKTHYKVIEIKAVWYWRRNRCIALNTRIKNKQGNLCIQGEMKFIKVLGQQNIEVLVSPKYSLVMIFNCWLGAVQYLRICQDFMRFLEG